MGKGNISTIIYDRSPTQERYYQTLEEVFTLILHIKGTEGF